MTTETALTDADKEALYNAWQDRRDEASYGDLIDSIEQAVLQSAEVKMLRKDAERYRWLRKRMIAVDFEYGDPKCIALAFEMPSRDMVFSADCDANVDLGMEQQP